MSSYGGDSYDDSGSDDRYESLSTGEDYSESLSDSDSIDTDDSDETWTISSCDSYDSDD